MINLSICLNKGLILHLLANMLSIYIKWSKPQVVVTLEFGLLGNIHENSCLYSLKIN